MIVVATGVQNAVAAATTATSLAPSYGLSLRLNFAINEDEEANRILECALADRADIIGY